MLKSAFHQRFDRVKPIGYFFGNYSVCSVTLATEAKAQSKTLPSDSTGVESPVTLRARASDVARREGLAIACSGDSFPVAASINNQRIT